MTNHARKVAKKRFPKVARNEQPITAAFIASLPLKHEVRGPYKTN